MRQAPRVRTNLVPTDPQPLRASLPVPYYPSYWFLTVFAKSARRFQKPLLKDRRSLSTNPYETPALIASAISSGDRKAEAVLYRKYYAGTLYLLERKSGDRELAQDLCQEAFVVLIERLRTRPLDEPGKLAAFLHNIAINLHIADIRKTTRRNTFTDADLMDKIVDGRQNQYRQLIKERAGNAVRHLIQSMSNARDRKVLHSYFIQEKEKDEICRELDLSQRHFDRVLFRAKERFRELIVGRSTPSQNDKRITPANG